MKRIIYQINIPSNIGSEENPVMQDCLYEKSLPYSAEAEEIAKAEAHNGEYTIEDDGIPTEEQPTPEQRIAELEAALEMILSGVVE